MVSEFFELIRNTKITFSSRPEPLPVEYRPIYRISLLVLTLSIAGWGGRSSLQKLHVLNWAMKNDNVEDFLSDSMILQHGHVNYEPGLMRAIKFALAEGLIKQKGNGVELTESGRRLANELAASDCFESEQKLLRRIKPYSKESRITEFLKAGVMQ